MFIRVIQGRATNPPGIRRDLGRWQRMLAADADGWLGSTAGITDDGWSITVVRFASEAQARRNSDRPEQREWWRDASQHLARIAVHDAPKVHTYGAGGADEAGFVQVIQGKVDDPSRLKAMMTDTTQLHEMRPEILGGTLAIEPDGTFTETVAFTDEAAAREGEQRMMAELPDDRREELESLIGSATFHDLHHPWFETA